MRGVRTRLAGPLLLSDQATEIYRVPTGKRANVRRITAFNGADHATTLTISIGHDSSSTRTLDAVHVPARSTYESKRYILSEGETVEAYAAYASEVTVMLNGYLDTVSELEDPLPVWIGQTAGYDGGGLATGFGNTLYAVRDWLETRYGRCRLTHLSLYCGAVVDGNVRLGFFDGDDVEPVNLLAISDEFTPVLGWNKLPVVAPVEFDPATYWTAFVCSSDALEVGIQSSNGVGFSNGARQVFPFVYDEMPAVFPDSVQFDSHHFSVYATLKAKTISRPADYPQQITPTAIIGQGMALTYQDDFDWYDRETWNNMIWYSAPAGTQDSIYCEDSVMHVVSKRPPGWVEGDPYNYCTASTLGRLHFTEGYFEARMRWPSEVGAWPACWMISSDWAKFSDCDINQASEIDVMEAVGDEPGSFYGTVHRDSSFQCEPNIQNSNNWDPVSPIVLSDSWHVYSCWWTSTFIKWYLDDVLKHEVAVGPGTDWDELEQEMQLLLQMWTMSNSGGWATHVNGSSADEIHAEIDWVRVWQVPAVPPVPTQTSVARVSLESGLTPPTDEDHSVRVRARIQIGNGTIRAAIYEGGVNRSGDLESPALTTHLTEHTLVISAAAAATITDYSNLELRFWGYDELGGATIFEIDQIWFHIPRPEGE